METTHVKTAVLGTGFSGLGMAYRLLQDGERDFVVLEKADDIGGTWRDNSYPGCACDVPSNLYSWSFAQNPTWSRSFSKQPEIHAYMKQVAARTGLLEKVKFGHDVQSATWSEADQAWKVETTKGHFTAETVITGMGGLYEPLIPKVEGLETFPGPMFHSARWDHDVDLAGQRVAVIGTGASAIQFVPEIQKQVGHLTVFQRTAPWLLPRTDRPLKRWNNALYRYVPGAQRAVRVGLYWGREIFAVPVLWPKFTGRLELVAKAHMNRAIKDPELREKLTPNYKIGCKRMLLSNTYYPALAKDNVSVETADIAKIEGNTIITADGTRHEADVIILGTGFHVTDAPVAQKVTGRKGQTLAEKWGGTMAAYKGTTIPDFPNFFMLLGPNTALGHTSVVVMIEGQIAQVRRVLAERRKRGAHTVEPTAPAYDAYNERVQRKSKTTVWVAGGCKSYYLDDNGKLSTIWPGFTFTFLQRMRKLVADDYTWGNKAPAAKATAPEPAKV
ncbi:MAG: NAD(P)/FAD-dependent oxidoreductase [Herbiconiux sp.]|nr:NAD(P)/FAD-dependent oxidoreductase [Herbiconiux sp.]